MRFEHGIHESPAYPATRVARVIHTAGAIQTIETTGPHNVKVDAFEKSGNTAEMPSEMWQDLGVERGSVAFLE